MKGPIAPVLLIAVGVAGLTGCTSPAEDSQVVLLQVDEDPTITFKVWFKTGSRDDPAGKEGLAWVTGQLLAEGGTTKRSYEEILQELYPLAAGYSTSVDREMTVLTGRTHRDNLELFFELFTDAYLRPAFDEEDFARIKTDTLNYLENALRFSSDEELGKAALHSLIFEGTSYAHPVEGTVEGVNDLTLEDVRDFYARRYSRENAVVALGGGFDDALVRRFEATLSELPAGSPAAGAPPDFPPFAGKQVLLVSKPDADASISFGFPIAVRRGEREFYALWLANSWLGEHRSSSSHLYQVIREARGMNYGDYSYIEAFTNGGRRSFPPAHVGRERQYFEVWIRTLPAEQAHFALRAALRELKLLVDNGLTEEQFTLTRDFLRKYLLHFADTTASRLGYAVDDRFYGIESPGHLARFRSVLDELTLDEVNAAIRKHLQYENVKIALVTGNAEAFRDALVADSTSPMTYASAKPDGVLEEDRAISGFPLGVEAGSVRIVPVDGIFQE